MTVSFADLEGIENTMFDIYNGQRRSQDEIEADLYGELEDYPCSRYGSFDSAEEGDRYYDPTLSKGL